MKYAYSDIQIDGQDRVGICLQDGEFAGILFSYGRVALTEHPESDSLTMEYHYDIIEGPSDWDEETTARFRTALGDLLLQLVQEGHKEGTVVYFGGTE